MNTMRVVFAGSPDVAAQVMAHLLNSGVTLSAVISQPDRPVGRKKVVTATPVSQLAEQRGIELYRPEDGKQLTETLRQLRPDLVVAVAYGRILRSEHLEIPAHGWWNLHFSLLPAYRGATPVQHALLAGERTTGVTVFRIDHGLDTGDILGQRQHGIEPFSTAGDLLHQLGTLGAQLLVELLALQAKGALQSRSQEGEPSFAPKLDRDAGRLDFHRPVAEVFRRWQAVTPEPGAFTPLRDRSGGLGIVTARPSPDVVDLEPGVVNQRNDRVFVGCERGALELITVHPGGKRPMPAMDWWRGAGQGAHCG